MPNKGLGFARRGTAGKPGPARDAWSGYGDLRRNDAREAWAIRKHLDRFDQVRGISPPAAAPAKGHEDSHGSLGLTGPGMLRGTRGDLPMAHGRRPARRA